MLLLTIIPLSRPSHAQRTGMLQLDLRFQMVRERSRDRRAHFNSNTLGLWPTLTWGRREDMVSLYFLFFFFCFHLFLPCCFFFAFPPIYRSDGHGLITPIGSADDRGGLVEKPILDTGNDAWLRVEPKFGSTNGAHALHRQPAPTGHHTSERHAATPHWLPNAVSLSLMREIGWARYHWRPSPA